MKKISSFFFLTFSFLVFSQTFEYERMWGTYYGPTNVALDYDVDNGGIFVNPATGNVHVNGQVFMVSNLPDSYYNQFITPGGQTITTSSGINSNELHASFDTNGQIVTSEYSGSFHTTIDRLVGFDELGQGIYCKYSQFPLADTTTPNAWFATDPNPVTGSDSHHGLMYKKDLNGNIIWKSYIPYHNYISNFVQDEDNNLYIFGSTKIQSNIGTNGTFQPNFEIYYAPNAPDPYRNGFVAKLSATGQFLWGTYLPAGVEISDATYFDNHLYIISSNDIDPSKTQLSTAGTWNTTKTYYALTKLDTGSGNRVWGTYIGDQAPSFESPVNVKVNSTGIYLLGFESLANSTNYFATPGAHKTQITGDSDLYLVKLDQTGNRVWGTYFGSDGFESLQSVNQLSIEGDRIFVAGATYGSGSNIGTSGSYLPTRPNGNIDFFFAQFNPNGQLQWCSYYGGANSYVSLNHQQIGIHADGPNTFYLYGSTNAPTGISSGEGVYQPQLPPNIGTFETGFLAKFDLKQQLGTSENHIATDLQLFNNPNNGNFSIAGDILSKESCKIVIYDSAGRQIYTEKLKKHRETYFQLQNHLVAGNYLLQVSNSKNEKIKVFKMIVK